MTALLITGSERSGTLYTATVLRNAGIDAGHERAVNIKGSRELEDGEVEVSWEAAPLGLAAYTVHQVRHPLQAIGSSAARQTFDWDHRRSAWGYYAARFFPEIATEPTPLLRAARYWLAWNGAIKADMRWQVETLKAAQLNKALAQAGHKVPTAAALRETEHVHESDAAPIEWGQLGHLEEPIRALAAEYGYE